MAFINTRPPWTGTRRRMLRLLPVLLIFFLVMVYMVFFYAPTSQDIWVFQLFLILAAVVFIAIPVYSVYSDIWWAYLPYNWGLFIRVNDGLERVLQENKIQYASRDSDSMNLVTLMTGRMFVILNPGGDLTIFTTFAPSRLSDSLLPKARIVVWNVTKGNLDAALRIQRLLTPMILEAIKAYENE